jgi:adenine/guanine phosphoribosyltransferase-like PRPP-binding protein
VVEVADGSTVNEMIRAVTKATAVPVDKGAVILDKR